MLKKIALALVVVIAAILAYAATRPDTFRVERSTTIPATPERVFGLVSDFHNWPSWSPWEKLDPAMKRSLSGAESGQGAVYAWEGNDKVGQGRMEILEATSPSKLRIQLDFLKPFESHNSTEFTFAPDGEGTRVTWAMTGNNNYIGKVMTLFFDMDKMVGKDFETGLQNLGAEAQKPAA
ncbi:MAG TPA: SRPBCC family protein [Thermoanaerobaculia bacterium]|nr:SRPBCC family protein [Thermoanaerobaculia bacterium]